MQQASRSRAFTLIELLTVIAIIAVLAAILFPIAGTVREQARGSSCMSNLHQIWVAATVYKQDEGEYPPALMGYAMWRKPGALDDGTQQPCDGSVPPCSTYTDANGHKPFADRTELVPFGRNEGTLYADLIKDGYGFRCPDVVNAAPTAITAAHFASAPPSGWADPRGYPYHWVGAYLSSAGCPSDAYGVVDCFTSGPLAGAPKYFYVWDAYDASPRVDETGAAVKDASGSYVYDRVYTVDWTGWSGPIAVDPVGGYAPVDFAMQLKYAQPPSDKTILTYCNWHAARAGTGKVVAISLAGSARKIDARLMVQRGPNVFNN